MVSRDAADSLAETDRDAFASALTGLKQRGAALLVVGNIPADEYAHACARMGGDETATRRRLFVTTAADRPPVGNRITADTGARAPEMATRIRWHPHARSTASESRSSYSQIQTVDVQRERLTALGIAISEEIAAFDTHADGLAPAELRICFDSVDSLLGTFDRASVFRFLHVLVSRIRSVNGLGHFHLPLTTDAELVQVFAPLFDAMVELRIGDEQRQQRWHLREPELTSPWLPLAASQ